MQDLMNAVDKNKQQILEAERHIWRHPETGYREFETAKYLENAFEKLGYSLTRAGDIPGFYTVLDTGRSGPEILVLAELDSLICPTHRDAAPDTGYVHACGHHAQCAALLGIAAALAEPGMPDKFCGRIKLCAVPAEELIEIGYRKELQKKGIIKYLGGKAEFLRRGYFDGADIAMLVHTSIGYAVRGGALGSLAKQISYKGVSAHAGGAPWDGVNALYAATQGLTAANAMRETFAERDLIRFHPIITHGGEAVNAIPERVDIESYVRGVSFAAIKEANRKINRALVGAALSIGANVEINDSPGYAPLKSDANLIRLAMDAFAQALPDEQLDVSDTIETGSTDMGELSGLMPVIHPYAAGAAGTGHGNDYRIQDPEKACVNSAKWQLAMLLLLLEKEAARAKEIIEKFEPQYASAEAYLAFVDSLGADGERICYKNETEVEIRL